MAGKFELTEAKDGQVHFHLKAGNGQIILSSELYTTKSAAENGITSVKKNASDDAHYERKETKDGHFMFNLKAANHQVIGTSQTYKSAETREEGIASVKENAPTAPVVEEV
ncbi:MAG TPA: YegP family protein [Edaphobacter sp.]|jgi:uncharacterized protein YegP (UPF0339 family)|nr:YegP family protein [Edaphobacter sp.]